VTSGAIGGVWDISWHESIGRDTFWTPAHLLIQFGGILAGLSCGYLILQTTFHKTSALHDASVAMWGFRGPLGAFLCVWGALAMVTSAPFDNWWHNAYGLDVKILSPPHVLLALGMMGIRFGTAVLIVAAMNRAAGAAERKLRWLLFYAALFLLGTSVGVFQEYTNRIFMHGARFYEVVMFAAPLWMALIAQAAPGPGSAAGSGSRPSWDGVIERWPATIMTTMYTAMHLAFIWILPLFPASPKLGPVYQKITHLVPPDFPLLLIAGAVVFDVLRPQVAGWGKWLQAAVLGSAFLGSFLAVQWPFANFLQSRWSHNRFFVANNYPYFIPSTSPWVRDAFYATEHTPQAFWLKMGVALAISIVMTRVGFAWGDWMHRLRR
jgi:hypothetical protein